MNATHYKADGEIIDLGSEPLTLEQVQKCVGGYVALIGNLNSNKIMLVNEEGNIHRLPYNSLASEKAGIMIVGDVVVCDRELFT